MSTTTAAIPARAERVVPMPAALPVTELRRALERQRELLTRDADLTFRRLAAVADLMGEIDAAFSRMDEGTYGLCRRCRQTIPLARLSLMPYARYCAGCQFAEAPVIEEPAF